MAQPIPCDICRQTTADFMITATANGDTLGVGIECLAAWAEALVAEYDRMRSEAPPVDHATDGMPTESPAEAAHGPVEPTEGPDDGSTLTDEEWESSAEIEAQRGRVPTAPEGEQESEQDSVPPTAADVNS